MSESTVPSRALAVPRPMAAALAAMFLAVAVTAVVLANQVSHTSAIREHAAAQSQVLAVATRVAEDFTTYDYRHLDEAFKRTSAGLSPRFKKSYVQTTARLRPTLRAYKATSRSDVKVAAVVYTTSQRARVIAFVDQRVTNARVARARTDRARMELDLVRSGRRWLVDNVRLV